MYKEHYGQYGFDCICIWEDEIDDIDLILNKIGDD
jgi:hypothetical protein